MAIILPCEVSDIHLLDVVSILVTFYNLVQTLCL